MPRGSAASSRRGSSVSKISGVLASRLLAAAAFRVASPAAIDEPPHYMAEPSPDELDIASSSNKRNDTRRADLSNFIADWNRIGLKLMLMGII